jgi:hypothetical protein
MAAKLAELSVVLPPLGFNADDVRQMLLRDPFLLLRNPNLIAQNLQALRVSPLCWGRFIPGVIHI